MSIADPRWRTLSNYPGYEISEEGDVRCWIYRGATQSKPRMIVPYLSNSNRWAVKLMVKDPSTGRSRRLTISLGVMLLLAFRGEPAPDEVREVDFKDSNPYNVHLSNIHWRKNLQKFKHIVP